MGTCLLRCGLVLVVPVGLVALLGFNISLAAQIPIVPGTTISPPAPMAAIELVKDSGVERWQVKLTRGGKVEDVHLRILRIIVQPYGGNLRGDEQAAL